MEQSQISPSVKDDRKKTDQSLTTERDVTDEVLIEVPDKKNQKEDKLLEKERVQTDQDLHAERVKIDLDTLQTSKLLAEVESELEVAQIAAESANKTKAEFLANISHEIRTPLSAIIGFSELLVNPENNLSDKINFVAAIKRNVELLATIITDILDVSKIEDHSSCVQGLGFQFDLCLAVVAMGMLAFALVVHQAMTITKMDVSGYTVHGAP